jgi:protein gp37
MFDRINEGRYWDFGWDLVSGCTRVSEGCMSCWFLSMRKRFSKEIGIVFHLERIMRPFKRRKPASYAIWGDLFHESVTFDQIDQVFDTIMFNLHHIFYILTKRPERMLEYFNSGRKWMLITKEFPLPNVLIGTTVENQKYANIRIPILLKIPAKIRFISCEPLLGQVDLKNIQQFNSEGKYIASYQVLEPILNCGDSNRPALDLIICGPETGTKARPMQKEWIELLYSQCKAANVPFFDKKNILGLNIKQLPNVKNEL